MSRDAFNEAPTEILADVRDFGLGDAFWARHPHLAVRLPARDAESLLAYLAGISARAEEYVVRHRRIVPIPAPCPVSKRKRQK
jgi:hypothetical protein